MVCNDTQFLFFSLFVLAKNQQKKRLVKSVKHWPQLPALQVRKKQNNASRKKNSHRKVAMKAMTTEAMKFNVK